MLVYIRRLKYYCTLIGVLVAMQMYAENIDGHSGSSSGVDSEDSENDYVGYIRVSIKDIRFKINMGSRMESVCSNLEMELLFCKGEDLENR